MKLIQQAKLYWYNVERLLIQGGQPPIRTWDQNERKAARKVPSSYRQCFFDQWQKLRQGNGSVKDYIAKFDEYLMRYGATEEREVTFSRFRAGL